MDVRVVAMPEARLMVCVDLDERYTGADHGDDCQREYYVAGALVDCRQAAHCAATLPDIG